MLSDKAIEPRRTIDDAWSEDWAVRMLRSACAEGHRECRLAHLREDGEGPAERPGGGDHPHHGVYLERTNRDLVNEELVLVRE